jgi:hypothetical protein
MRDAAGEYKEAAGCVCTAALTLHLLDKHTPPPCLLPTHLSSR